jgi:hypothetical protein
MVVHMVCYITEKILVCVCTEEEIRKSYHGSKPTPAGEALKRLLDYLEKLGRGE